MQEGGRHQKGAGKLLNLAKCKLFAPGISQFTSFVYEIIPKVPLSEGSVFLGVPIGSDSVEKALDETIKKLECLIAKVGHRTGCTGFVRGLAQRVVKGLAQNEKPCFEGGLHFWDTAYQQYTISPFGLLKNY